MAGKAQRRKTIAEAGTAMERSLSYLLARALEERWRRVTVELARSSRRCTEESIHDLRVAMRRLMASMDMVLEVRPAPDLSRARRMIRKHLKTFNALRDTHVQILALRRLTRRFPVVRAYRDELRRRERLLVAEARKELPRVHLKRVEGPIARATQMLMSELSDPVSDAIARTVAFGVLGSAFAVAADRERHLSGADPLTIHRLRVAFKKCRYSTEILHALLPGATRRMMKSMNAYQTRMGEIQDLRILSSGVSAYAMRRRGARGSFVPVQEFLAGEQQRRVARFLSSAAELYSFWTLGAARREVR